MFISLPQQVQAPQNQQNLGPLQIKLSTYLEKAQEFMERQQGLSTQQINNCVKFINYAISKMRRGNYYEIPNNEANKDILIILRESVSDQIQRLRDQINNHNHFKESIQKQLDDRTTQIQIKSNEIQLLKNQLQELQANNLFYSTQYNISQQQMQGLNNQLNNLEQLNSNLTKQNKELEQDLRIQTYKLDKLKYDYDQTLIELNNLQKLQYQDTADQLFYEQQQIFQENQELKQQQGLNLGQNHENRHVRFNLENENQQIININENSNIQGESDTKKNYDYLLIIAIGLLVVSSCMLIVILMS